MYSILTSPVKLQSKENKEVIICTFRGRKAEMAACTLLDISELTLEITIITEIHRAPSFRIKASFCSEKHPAWKTEKKSLVKQRGCRAGAKHLQQSVYISLAGAYLIRLHLLFDKTVAVDTEKYNFVTETLLLKIRVCLILVLPYCITRLSIVFAVSGFCQVPCVLFFPF